VLRIWGSINRLYEMISGEQSYLPWLDYFQSFGDTSQGWINCVFFVMMSKRVRGRYAAVIKQTFSSILHRTGGTEFSSCQTDDAEPQLYDGKIFKAPPSHQSPLLDPEDIEEEEA